MWTLTGPVDALKHIGTGVVEGIARFVEPTHYKTIEEHSMDGMVDG